MLRFSNPLSIGNPGASITLSWPGTQRNQLRCALWGRQPDLGPVSISRRFVGMKKLLPVLAVAVCLCVALPCYADCGCGGAPSWGYAAASCDSGCHQGFFSRFGGHFRHHESCTTECAAPACGCAEFAAPTCGCDTGCHRHHSFRLFSGFGCHHASACDCAPPAPTCCAAPPAPTCCAAPAPCAPSCGCERHHHHWFGHHHHSDCGCGAPAPSCGCGY